MQSGVLGEGTLRTARAYVAWVLRHRRIVLALALLLAVPATYRTVWVYAHLRTEVEALLPQHALSVVALNDMRARYPGLQYLSVVTESPNGGDLPAAERFVDDLASRIRSYPKDMVREVRTTTTEERNFIETRAPLFVDTTDLETLRRRIEARRDYEVSKASGFSLDDDAPAPSMDFSDIEKHYSEKAKGESSRATDRFSSAPGVSPALSMLFVEVAEFNSGSNRGRELLERVKADVAGLGGPSKYAPALRVGYASDVAINVEEAEALEGDLSISSALVIAAVMALVVLYYRWWKSIVIILVPLLLGTVYAFALASVPPVSVKELNSNSAFLGSIIVGNGINVGLMLLARYREERLLGRPTEESLAYGVASVFRGTLASAVAASVSYASLVVTEFQGFQQFGYIGGIGLVTSWLCAFLLQPILVAWADSGPAPATTTTRREPFRLVTAGAVAIVRRATVPVVVLAVAFSAAAVWKVSTWDASQIETDFSKLRRYDTWVSGEGYWGRKMDGLLGRYLTPTALLFDTPRHARAVEASVREAATQGSLKSMVATVRSLDDVFPPDQEARAQKVREIKELLTPKIRSLLDDEKRQALEKFLGEAADSPGGATVGLEPFSMGEVPRTLLTGLVEHDGTAGRSLLVFPKPSNILWEREGIETFTRTLRDMAATHREGAEGPGQLAGSIPLTADILTSIDRDGPRATAIAFVGVLVTVLAVVGWKIEAAYVVGSLLMGVAWLLALGMALGVKLNFCNFIAIPITLGIGVEYAVNIVSRYAVDGSKDIASAVRSTGSAVTLCSLTTIIGYSSLLLAKNRALYNFGLLAVLGEFTCLATAVLVVPAIITLRERHMAARSAAGATL